MNFMEYLTPLVMAKVAATIACLTFFVIQSQEEMKKFFSKMTSASMQDRTDIKVKIPKIVICSDEPFKSDKFPETLEEYIDTTYSKNEVMGAGVDGVNVTEMATLLYGMCFALEISKDYKDILQHPKDTRLRVNIPLNTTKEVNAYFVDHGQEICFKDTAANCEVPHGVILKEFYTQVVIKAKISILEERYIFELFIYIFHNS